MTNKKTKVTESTQQEPQQEQEKETPVLNYLKQGENFFKFSYGDLFLELQSSHLETNELMGLCLNFLRKREIKRLMQKPNNHIKKQNSYLG